MTETTGIQQACDAMSVMHAGPRGGQTELAKALGVSQQAVAQWVKQGYAPLDRIPDIVALVEIDPKRLADPRTLETLGVEPAK